MSAPSRSPRIAPGDRVAWNTPRGQKRSGRVVMASSEPGSWVINAGGPHGTPAVVPEALLVLVKRGPRKGWIG